MDPSTARRSVTAAALGITALVAATVARDPLAPAPTGATRPAAAAASAGDATRSGALHAVVADTPRGPEIVYVTAPVQPAGVSAAPAGAAPAPVASTASS
ncbi:MAG: hypothetical protein KDC33_00505 [Thermoleophilia bacterium]|nr:hypothetical protein [Thermoleophilia bacterium]